MVVRRIFVGLIEGPSIMGVLFMLLLVVCADGSGVGSISDVEGDMRGQPYYNEAGSPLQISAKQAHSHPHTKPQYFFYSKLNREPWYYLIIKGT